MSRFPYLGVHVSGPVVGNVKNGVNVLVFRPRPNRAVVTSLKGKGALVLASGPLRRPEISEAKKKAAHMRAMNEGDVGLDGVLVSRLEQG